MSIKQTASIALLAAFTFTPIAALAATVTVADDSTIILPSDGSIYTISSGSTFDSLTVNTSSFIFDMSTGETVTITSADKKTLTTNPATTATCGSNQSSVVLTVPSTISSQTVEVTPSGTCSSTSNASSNTSGGGTIIPSTPPASSGGGSPPPPPAPAPTPAPATPSSSAPGQTPAPKGASTVIPALVQSVFFKNLSPGAKGDEVRQLQEFLKQDKVLYPEGIANGVFGPATKRAVQRFQKKYGISQTGTLGPQTRTKMMQIFGSTSQTPASISETPTPVTLVQGNGMFEKDLAIGSRNDDVRRLQQLLSQDANIYAEGIVNGNFGPATQRAIKKFQEKYEIKPANGRAGPLTRAKLQEVFGGSQPAAPAPVPVPTAPVPVPAPSANTKALQDQLTQLLKQLEELKKK
ncbi:MAG: peptidoglycan-binding protein [Candidatus Sungbacteria bacterium]|nr:peptidoglycan-binding protein [Candidatus Sungbacteria bacterium]